MLVRGESKKFKSIKTVIVSCLIPNQIWQYWLPFPDCIYCFRNFLQCATSFTEKKTITWSPSPFKTSQNSVVGT